VSSDELLSRRESADDAPHSVPTAPVDEFAARGLPTNEELLKRLEDEVEEFRQLQELRERTGAIDAGLEAEMLRLADGERPHVALVSFAATLSYHIALAVMGSRLRKRFSRGIWRRDGVERGKFNLS
jgi:hypothetical protein